MFKIRLGPAGIPIASESRDSISGVKTVNKLGLNSMEVEFVRGVHMSNETAKELGKVSKDLDIELSVHAPYYINLCSEEKAKITASRKRILDSMERAETMGAKIVVVHPGYYGKYSKDECFKIIKEQCREVVEKHNGSVLLGLETTAKMAAFGSVEEILKICDQVKGCAPVIDFAHLFARQNGSIDYGEILEKFKKFTHLHCHFSNMKRNKTGGYSDIHLPIDNAPPFKPLAEEIIKRKVNITIISESPILEQDSLKMKKIFEDLGYAFSK